jgi:hypothetical protein
MVAANDRAFGAGCLRRVGAAVDGVLDIAKPFVVQCPSLPPRMVGVALP